MWILVVLLLSVQTGTCAICQPGYYGKYNCRPCPNNCATCTSNYCQSCRAGYYGYICGNTCPINCVTCTSSSYCHSCNAGYYDGTCDKTCPDNCATCTWQTRFSCTTCKAGYYGTGCVSRCSNACQNGQCDMFDGSCICFDGYFRYYQINYPHEYVCARCPSHCTTCRSSSVCTSCNAGYFGSTCDQTCHNCRNNSCVLHNGSCSNGCNDGYYQEKTGCTPCPGNCSICSSETDCYKCKPTYYGNMCQQHSTTCVSLDICYQCVDGFWGQYCGIKCKDTCIQCNKSNGACTECKDNTFGRYCERKCGGNCVQSDNNSACWQHNGTCIDGCMQGFTGHDCSDEFSSETSPQVAMIVGSTFGVVAFIVVIVIVVIIVWRRRVRKQDSKAKGREPMGSRCLHAVNEVLNLAYGDTNNVQTSVSGHQKNNSAETIGSADNAYVYAVVQKETLRNPAKPNKAPGHEIDNVYDVSRGGHGPGMQADSKSSQAEGDTYSHINHASRARQLHHDDEGAYDHVTRHNLRKGDDDDTYDVTSGSHDNNYHVHGTSKQSTDEYSTIGLVQ